VEIVGRVGLINRLEREKEGDRGGQENGRGEAIARRAAANRMAISQNRNGAVEAMAVSMI
jgi:hypothetical protein